MQLSQTKPNFIMLVGTPYSGKSFLVKSLGILEKDYIVISSDNIILEWAVAENSTYNDIFKERIDQAQKEAVKRLIEALKQGKNVVLDQTNLTKASRARKLCLVPKHYNKVCIVVETPSDEEIVIRKQNRLTHSVPDSVLNNMKNIYQKPLVEEGFDLIYYAGFDDIFIV